MRLAAAKRLLYNDLADCDSPDDTVMPVRQQDPTTILIPFFRALLRSKEDPSA